jgi:vacuolar protein sorting-associated protein 35
VVFQLYRDGKRVLECLQRALRVADSCMETATSIELFVEILDRYVYYFDQQNESVSFLSFLLFHFPRTLSSIPSILRSRNNDHA